MNPLFIYVDVKRIDVSDLVVVNDYFGRIEACLGRAGWMADETSCTVWQNGGGGWLKLPYAQRSTLGQYDGVLWLHYKNVRTYMQDLIFWTGTRQEIPGFNFQTRFPVGWRSYSTRMMEEAYLLQSLGRDLYVTMSAESVVAISKYQEEYGEPPWFKFSKEECIEIGTFSTDEKLDDYWLEDDP